MNYKETQIDGSSYVRCTRVVVDNGIDGSKSISFAEEQVISIVDEVIRRPIGNLSLSLTDSMGDSFDVLNPETGEVTGLMTFEQAYAVVHSAYMHAANKRDAD
ncbi:hypothetical protein D3C87_1267040 [compost metagenome]